MSKLALIIDDLEFSRTTISTYLKVAGFENDIAENGAVALKKLAEKSYDLIISDIEMPNMNGMEFLKRVKSNPAFQNIPVIMITRLNDQATIEKTRQLGAIAYLTRPYNREKITLALKAAGF